jgi:cyclopropane fatty-acyl-phospholipid synthase-like methyltransferase
MAGFFIANFSKNLQSKIIFKPSKLQMKELWNSRYQAQEYIYGQKENDFLRQNLHYLKRNKLLSLAEGEGRNGIFLAKNNFEVTGVDFSVEAKNKALALAENNNVEIDYKIADLQEFDLGFEVWDSVVAIFCHLEARARKSLLERVKKSLKTDGIFLLEAYNCKQISRNSGGPKNFEMLFSSCELEEIFANFEILHCQNLVREVNEGILHQGEAEVVQFIARRC